jgi:beta-glucosidase
MAGFPKGRISMINRGCARVRTTALMIAICGLFGFSEPLATSRAAEPKNYSSFDAQVKPIVAQMTLDEKVGQMTQPELEYVKNNLSDIEKYFVGSVLSGGGSDPKEGNSLDAWTNVYDECQKHAIQTRLGIPIVYGIDAVHGHSNVLGAVIFPHNVGLGCTRDTDLVRRIGRVTAEEVRASGINWTFGPCVTVPQDERWGRAYEGFSEDPQLVARLGEAEILGLQGERLSDPLAVVACAKHFLGDGGTSPNSGDFKLQEGTSASDAAKNAHPHKIRFDQGDTRVDEATLRRIHMAPYLPAINAGVGSIMPSYSSWNGAKLSGDKYLLTDVLKGELGFEGFLISDYNAIDQINKDYKESVAASINAGMDMVMVPSHYKEFIRDLKELVQEGRVPMERIDDAVTRILRVKAALGLLDKGRSPLADRNLQKSFGSPEHREVAREAVRKSLVLLKNDDQTLPLSKKLARIHVAGKSADDIGNQCGGWTIEWQGKSGNVTTGGTTVLTAIKHAVSEGTQVTFSKDGTGAEGASVGIVVIGETPYAEGVGDSGDLALAKEDVEAIRTMKSAGIPVVVILFSGRPLIISDVFDQASAFVAAWLPGTEGDGVTDVLFGDYKPTGKLSFTWPRTADQIPLHKGDTKYDPLFPIDYGLTYETK